MYCFNKQEIMKYFLKILFSCSLLCFHQQALAQFPSQPIKYIVPVSAGGGSDMVGREVMDKMGKVLGQTIIVDNQGGGGGIIAAQNTMRAAPDGYTLMQGYVATHGTSPATRKVPYDAVKDFTPIGMIGATPNALIVNNNFPAKTAKELIELVKRNPNKYSYGSSGQGSLTHLCGELFNQQAGVSIAHVPYRGIAPAITDLIGGQTQIMFPGLAAAMPHIKAGKVRILAITGKVRHPLVKDTPTLEEIGLKGFDAVQWYGVVGPAKMSPQTVKVLNEALNKALSSSELKSKLAGEAIEPNPMSPDEFGKYIQGEISRWTKLAREKNIQLDN